MCYVAAVDWSDDVPDKYVWYLLQRTIADDRAPAARDDPARSVLTFDQLQA